MISSRTGVVGIQVYAVVQVYKVSSVKPFVYGNKKSIKLKKTTEKASSKNAFKEIFYIKQKNRLI